MIPPKTPASKKNTLRIGFITDFSRISHGFLWLITDFYDLHIADFYDFLWILRLLADFYDFSRIFTVYHGFLRLITDFHGFLTNILKQFANHPWGIEKSTHQWTAILNTQYFFRLCIQKKFTYSLTRCIQMLVSTRGINNFIPGYEILVWNSLAYIYLINCWGNETSYLVTCYLRPGFNLSQGSPLGFKVHPQGQTHVEKYFSVRVHTDDRKYLTRRRRRLPASFWWTGSSRTSGPSGSWSTSSGTSPCSARPGRPSSSGIVKMPMVSRRL
jgi:hypothetical protein